MNELDDPKVIAKVVDTAITELKAEVELLRNKITYYKEQLAKAENDAEALKVANNEFRLMMLGNAAMVQYSQANGMLSTLFFQRKLADISKLDFDTQLEFFQLHTAHAALFGQLVHEKRSKTDIKKRIAEKSEAENKNITATRESHKEIRDIFKDVSLSESDLKLLSSIEDKKHYKAILAMAKIMPVKQAIEMVQKAVTKK